VGQVFCLFCKWSERLAEEKFGAERLRKAQKQYSGEEKMALLRRHLLEKTPVSTLCDEANIQPTVFYRWQEKLFKSAEAVFQRSNSAAASQQTQQQARVEKLEEKMRQKNEVIAELMAEHVALKKATGEL
jgi:transposase